MNKIERTKLIERVREVLTSAKGVEVVSQETVLTRNEKGHFNGAKVRMVLNGHAVSVPIKRTYFRNTRVAKLQEEGVNITMPRMKKNSGEVVIELVA